MYQLYKGPSNTSTFSWQQPTCFGKSKITKWDFLRTLSQHLEICISSSCGARGNVFVFNTSWRIFLSWTCPVLFEPMQIYSIHNILWQGVPWLNYKLFEESFPFVYFEPISLVFHLMSPCSCFERDKEQLLLISMPLWFHRPLSSTLIHNLVLNEQSKVITLSLDCLTLFFPPNGIPHWAERSERIFRKKKNKMSEWICHISSYHHLQGTIFDLRVLGKFLSTVCLRNYEGVPCLASTLQKESEDNTTFKSAYQNHYQEEMTKIYYMFTERSVLFVNFWFKSYNQ